MFGRKTAKYLEDLRLQIQTLGITVDDNTAMMQKSMSIREKFQEDTKLTLHKMMNQINSLQDKINLLSQVPEHIKEMLSFDNAIADKIVERKVSFDTMSTYFKEVSSKQSSINDSLEMLRNLTSHFDTLLENVTIEKKIPKLPKKRTATTQIM